jgi:hypothetical protein
MVSAVVMTVLTQVFTCSPSDMSAVCNCKAGMMSACATLLADEPENAERLLNQVEGALTALEALQMAGKAKSDKDNAEKERLQKIAQAIGGETSEPPNCKGQEHHLISRRVARELEKHRTLKGLFKPRDPRYVARARDDQAHCGYQDWHRKVDEELMDWLTRWQKATPEDFLDKLREIYSRPEMKARFPNGF